jgi:glycine C-acetyltransferase
MRLAERIESCSAFMGEICPTRPLYMRMATTAADREVAFVDPYSGASRSMLMFGSNNYLGLANHPHVREQVKRAADRYGVGLAGPPLLNGHTVLHAELEERLAALKRTESALIFPTGYSANLGLLSGLLNGHDRVVYDELSHASFRDGLQLKGADAVAFLHNDTSDLQRLLLEARRSVSGDIFVGVEGVYSMDGDVAPLPAIHAACRLHDAFLVLDDAHGTGIMGACGSGTAEHFGLEGQVDVTMGTFSKVFGVVGGFVAASASIVEYLRFFARSYMFSASLPPVVVAAVLAGLDVIRDEPERLQRLRENVRYLGRRLRELGLSAGIESPIVALRVPPTMDLASAARRMHEAGLFVNAVVFPAVRETEQRFRISLMSEHTREDLDRLLDCISTEWGCARSGPMHAPEPGIAGPAAGTGLRPVCIPSRPSGVCASENADRRRV